MSRPLQGTKRQTATGWEAALPVERGSTKRVRWVFLTEDAAQRWLDVAKSDIQHGRSLTQPSPVDLAPTKGRKATPTGTAFRDMATQWADERYLKIQSGGPSREVTVRSHIRRISDWMESLATSRGPSRSPSTESPARATSPPDPRQPPA